MGHATVAVVILLSLFCCYCEGGIGFGVTMKTGNGAGSLGGYAMVKINSPVEVTMLKKESVNQYWDDDDDDDENKDAKSLKIAMADKETARRFQGNKETYIQRIKSALRNFYKPQ